MIDIPIYVTRKNAEGKTGTWTINPYIGFAILVLAIRSTSRPRRVRSLPTPGH